MDAYIRIPVSNEEMHKIIAFINEYEYKQHGQRPFAPWPYSTRSQIQPPDDAIITQYLFILS